MVLRFLDFYDSIIAFAKAIYGWFGKLGISLPKDTEGTVSDVLDGIDDVNTFSRGNIWAFFMGK